MTSINYSECEEFEYWATVITLFSNINSFNEKYQLKRNSELFHYFERSMLLVGPQEESSNFMFLTDESNYQL